MKKSIRVPRVLNLWWLCVLCVLGTIFSTRAQATTVTFQNDLTPGGYTGMQTTWLFQNYPNNSKGADNLLNVGAWVGGAGNTNWRSLLRANLTSLAGSYTSITAVRLKLKVASVESSGGAWTNQPFNVYRVSAANKAWAPGNSVDGPQTGAACWNYLSYNSNLDPTTGELTGVHWAGSEGMGTAGTDFLATPVATASVSSSVTSGSIVTFTFSDLSFFDSWINDNTNNAGFLIKAPTLEPNRFQWISFYSVNAGSQADRPSLEIDVNGYKAPPGAAIDYNLSSAGRVSINIYDSTGQIVREFLHGDNQAAGAHHLVWNGLNEQGQKVPNGNYSWKLLQTPGALSAKYLMTLGTNSSPDTDSYTANDEGPRGLAVDSSGVYLSGAVNEGPHLVLKQNSTGSRLWTYGPTWLPDVNWEGGQSMATDGSTLYMMLQSGRIARFNASTGEYLGLWNTAYTSGEDVGDWVNRYDMAYGGGKLMISIPGHNAVRWINPSNGSTLAEVAVPSPQGVALDSDGDAYVISGTQIVKITYGSSTLTPVVTTDNSNLVKPWRLTVDPTNGNLLVADLGACQQVKRFNPNNNTLIATYGAYGGRQEGLYNGNNFHCITAIAAAPDGTFWITEAYTAPRRMAHYSSSGSLIKDFNGGQVYSCYSTPDPADPSLIWMDGGSGEIMQLQVDYASKSWTVRAVYYMTGHGFINGDSFPGPALAHGIGMNRDKMHIMHRNGLTYVYLDGYPQVQIVDETNGRLRPAVTSGKYESLPSNLQPPNTGQRVYMWVDLNGDGQPATNEITFSNTDYFDACDSSGSGWMANDFTLYLSQYPGSGGYSPSTGPAKLVPQGFTVGGAPIYDWNDMNYSWSNGLPASFSHTMPVAVQGDGAGNIYGAYNLEWNAIGGSGGGGGANGGGPVGFWAARVGDTKLVKWNAAGQRQWVVGRQSRTGGADPGEMRFLERFVGVAHNCIVASDVENNLMPVYDPDGLWVGRLLDQPVNDGTPSNAYDMGENFGGQIYTDPNNGNVYYYGSANNSTRVIQITGWDGWTRQNGSLTVGAPPTGLAAQAGNAQINLSWDSNGEASSYNLKRGSSSGGPFATVANNLSGTTYTDTPLTNGTTYYYVVTGIGINGETANSNVASATPGILSSAPIGKTVSLKSAINSKYASVNSSTGVLSASQTTLSDSAKFLLGDGGSGAVSLKSFFNNQYVCADNYGNDALIANRGSAAGWELFDWVNNGDGSVSLNAHANTKYVSAPNSGNDPLIASASAITTQEKFYFELVMGTGNITHEIWEGVGGTAVSQIPVATTPTSTDTLTSLEGPTNRGDNYGSRIRGYITAPTSGNYTFWVAGDDNCELWLGTSSNPASKVKIATVDGWTNSRDWNVYTTQKSAVIVLTAGEQYYVEVLQKEANGGDNIAVGWLKPGQTGTVPSEIVPGYVLSPYAVPLTFGNAGFESPTTSSYTYNPTGTAWTFIGGAGVQTNGSAWGVSNAPEGVQTAFLQTNASISQSVNVTTAGTYVVTFQGARRQGQAQPLKLSVDGIQVGSLLTPAGNSFALLTSASFIISGLGNHTIKLETTDSSGDLSSLVDDIKIVQH